jgi:hypothetical protein
MTPHLNAEIGFGRHSDFLLNGLFSRALSQQFEVTNETLVGILLFLIVLNGSFRDTPPPYGSISRNNIISAISMKNREHNQKSTIPCSQEAFAMSLEEHQHRELFQ